MKVAIKPLYRHVSWQLVTLMGALIFVMIVNAVWLKIDHRPPRWDESSNLAYAERAFHLVREGKITEALNVGGALRPNFVPFLHSFLFSILGHSTKVAVLTLNSISLIFISLTLFGLGARIFDRNVGLLACIIFLTFPSVSLWSRYYNLDLPLTAFLTSTVWAAVAIEQSEYKSKFLSVLLGVLIGVGMASKHLYSAFAFFPLAWLLGSHLTRNGFKPIAAIKSAPWLYGFFAAGILFGVYYHLVINFASFWEGVVRSLFTEKSALMNFGFYIPTPAEKFFYFIDLQLYRNP